MVRTPRGDLATELRNMEPELYKVTQGRVKIVERNGTKMEHLLVRNNPWATDPCTRPSCTVCQQSDAPTKPNCRTRNIT